MVFVVAGRAVHPGTTEPMRILAISGSLRSASSNTAVLLTAAALAPRGVEVTLYEGLADLPHFNPDLDTTLDDPRLPAPVRTLRMQVGSADGLLISSPEYAHGVPGSLKNALDWLVGSSEFPGKPVALLSTSARATHAQASLAETLRTMSADLVTDTAFVVSLAGKNLDAAVEDPEIAKPIREALTALTRGESGSDPDSERDHLDRSSSAPRRTNGMPYTA